MFDFITDHNFLNALAAMIGPLAFFAAPTEEIEHLLFHQDEVGADVSVALPVFVSGEEAIAEAA